MLNMYNNWLNSIKVDEKTKKELLSIKNNQTAIIERFAFPMQFGTAGLRSTMAAGISKMNVYTVAHFTRGLAELILNVNAADRGVAVAYDCRNNSELFAKTTARVLAAYGIKVYLFDSLRPTPELSFAVLNHGCIAGINITASHNPKEYNGYKVYWEDGAQLPPEHAMAVSDAVDKTDIFEDVQLADFEKAVADGIIIIIGKETDDKFLDAVLNCRICPEMTEQFGDSLNIIYTPIHGTGYRLVPEVLKRAGITNLLTVESQMIPDGNFPTVVSPNPENKECFELAIEMVKNQGGKCDLILGTDPDGDRVGVVINDTNGNFFALNGNQIGAILIDYIIKGRKHQNNLPENACAIKSIVSSNLFDAICDKAGVKHLNVLTGFKYIGEKIKEFKRDGTATFIFGYEESHGFLSDGYVRDKDAVAACMLIAEAASFYKSKEKTLYDVLQDIYSEYGFYKEAVLNNVIAGVDPMTTMSEKMLYLRQSGINSIGGTEVIAVGDYKSGIKIYLKDGKTEPTGLPESDMLYYELTDRTSVIVRPSGTEPKIKVYILAVADNENACDALIEKYKSAMKALVG
ncbi:MAG: phosphoglucomutase [Clostridiales bacterium GWF2_36_10]|nr:MAG: phosphoglucomutase [Clostridiales bacterium GWF2_36_10]HAN21374.1 phosphoglucomutase [Clostridiales bacterium]